MPANVIKFDINTFYPKFLELNKTTQYIYTDGACIGNGKAYATASFATIVGNTYFAASVNECSYKMENYIIIPNIAAPAVKPSNNRGELLGIIFGLLAVRHLLAASDRIVIYTDSNYALKTLLYYYPARISKGTQNQLLNPDLLEIGHKLLTELPCIELVHIKAHQTTTKCSMCNTCDDCINRLGNESADAYAGLILGQTSQVKPQYRRTINETLKKCYR
jgi:ribonuclease HI